MARPLRPLLEGGIYHVYNRGNAKQPIFETDRDRFDFLDIVRHVRDLCGWRCLAYCLMGNHYHLVVETPVANLARGMRQLNSGYAQRFNKRHERCGHLFQGRYGSRLIQDGPHLLVTLRYVALNPVGDALCTRPESWRWSSHRALLGKKRSNIVDVPRALELIDEKPRRARAIYRAFVEDDAPPAEPEARGDVVRGDGAFTAAALAATPRPSTEVPLKQRLAARPTLDELFAHGREHALAAAYYEFGYSQAVIARHLGCHYSTVSRKLSAARPNVAMKDLTP